MTPLEKKILKAKTQIILKHAFWAETVCRYDIALDEKVPTCAVNSTGHITLNPKWGETLTADNLIFLFCHEASHVLFQHFVRRGARDPGKWNYCGDAIINDLLIESKVGVFIDGGVLMPGAKSKYTEQLYDEDDGQGGKGGGDIGGIGEDMSDEKGDSSEAAEAEAKIALSKAIASAKMRGQLPGGLEKFAISLLESKVPWYDQLEEFMVAFTKGEYTWRRPNKRFAHMGHYMPSVGNIARMGEVVLQVDVSGSISEAELTAYNGHVKRIVAECTPSKVHVLYVDTQVVQHDIFEEGEEVELKFRSGGGTDMPAGFAYIEDEGITPDVFVCLTDGYTPWGEPQDYPVVWCISSNAKPTHGKHITFSLEN